jgi:hypothetical protein
MRTIMIIVVYLAVGHPTIMNFTMMNGLWIARQFRTIEASETQVGPSMEVSRSELSMTLAPDVHIELLICILRNVQMSARQIA